MTVKWTGFVDESGKFESGDASVVVLLLTDATGRQVLDTSLRSALREQTPHVPWPPHAAEVRTAVQHVVWLLRQREAGRERGLGPTEDQAHAERALRILREVRLAPALRQAVEEAVSGGSLDLPALRAAWQRGTACLHDASIARIEEIRKLAVRAFESAVQSVLLRPDVRWLAAVAPGDAEVSGDPYLAAMADLFDRVYVGDEAGRDRPALRIQERWVIDPVTGTEEFVANRHVQRANATVHARRGALRGSPCHMGIEDIFSFRIAAEGGDVVVDWVSGRVLWAVNAPRGAEAWFERSAGWLPQRAYRLPAPRSELAPAGLPVVMDRAGREELEAYVQRLTATTGGTP